MKSSLSGLTFLAALVGVGYFLNHYLRPQSWGLLIVLAGVLGAMSLIAAWFALSNKDRRLMLDLVPVQLRPLAIRFLPL